MRYTRLFTDEHGASKFGESEFTFTSNVFAPPAPRLDVSNQFDATAFMFIHLPAGWTDDAHPAPARQFMIVMSGRGEVTAGGETRTFERGDVYLVEDISGPGHATTVFEDTVFAVVRV